ncbi:Nif3-like dinuclear metal center hexameric protein [Sphingomonas sp. BIUV-7]|uniref:Nif3-like dinuclear metal center hexameric protein n=1 Tax=Sphingomonas natans TaxID=3063330 RepID=A0ABT8YAE5_9SPHN|nr:Nif3-like dinuclear metal center hexameric protein [Sphingomonas sp. BIUV-7]MDO6415285.1 Nif3-like dinuclear metal center hexameric protein [Sphingomonas sp. BIUV-7]
MSDAAFLSRRGFSLGIAASAATLAMPAIGAVRAPTVDQVLASIRASCAAEGIAWSAQTVDTLKAGDQDMPVRAIAVTFMSTLSLLRKAVGSGANLIISHEPTFWSHGDTTVEWVNDPVYRAKMDFIDRNKLAIFRFHDHWHQTKPEPMSAATRARLGWERYLIEGGASGFEARYRRPVMPLSALLSELRDRLPSRSLRVIGRDDIAVSRIGFGGHNLDSVVLGLESNDVLIVPEVREFDTGSYLRDLVESGAPKALILMAHERGEADGMDACAHWLRRHVRDVPVRYIPSGEPFWTPTASTDPARTA